VLDRLEIDETVECKKERKNETQEYLLLLIFAINVLIEFETKK